MSERCQCSCVLSTLYGYISRFLGHFYVCGMRRHWAISVPSLWFVKSIQMFLCCFSKLRPNKIYYMLRITRPYLNLLVKPRIFFRTSGKYIIVCILKGEMPFKIHQIINSLKKYVCLPYLKTGNKTVYYLAK